MSARLFQREDASLKYASNESSLKQHSRFGETGRRSTFDELGNSLLPGEIGCPPKFHPNGFSAGILDPVRHIGYPAEQPCGERSSPARRRQYELAYSDPKNGCSPECRKRSGRRYFSDRPAVALKNDPGRSGWKTDRSASTGWNGKREGGPLDESDSCCTNKA